jgi:translocation and assembly module TamA
MQWPGTSVAAGWILGSALALAGCTGLWKPAKPPDAPASTGTHSTEPLQAQYRLEIQAPKELRKLLSEQSDLARFQNMPAAEQVNAAELERLRLAAPAEMMELLETEGYFNAKVTVDQVAADSRGLAQLRVVVEAGPRTTVGTVSIGAIGKLQDAVESGDPGALSLLADLRRQWPLHSGAPFEVSAWMDAKTDTINRVRTAGYASASWARTNAHVDASRNRADLAVVLDSGPLFRLGDIHIDGLKRYDEQSVRRLAGFDRGAPYNEKTLLYFQERLQKVGLFEGASVEIDPDTKSAAAAAVRVRVQELPMQQVTTGIGYSANTGASASLEHIHRNAFGSGWMARNKFQYGPDLHSWEGDLTSHPLAGLSRNLVSGSFTDLRADDQWQRSWTARMGRTQDNPRLERTIFAEYAQARVDSAALASQADSVSLNQQWVVRNVDSVLLPTVGLTASAQAAVGTGRGSRTAPGEPPFEERGPFARLYVRLTWYRILGASWYGTARIEAGQVFTHDVVAVPDTLLFRAGGDDSVRGYGYRTLGPTIEGTTTSGRSLATGSIEIARPIWSHRPAYWWAAFIDAGNAADQFGDLNPVLGYGLGLRWRSPVGPLRFDVAYGQALHQTRLHMSVGIAF